MVGLAKNKVVTFAKVSQRSGEPRLVTVITIAVIPPIRASDVSPPRWPPPTHTHTRTISRSSRATSGGTRSTILGPWHSTRSHETSNEIMFEHATKRLDGTQGNLLARWKVALSTMWSTEATIRFSRPPPPHRRAMAEDSHQCVGVWAQSARSSWSGRRCSTRITCPQRSMWYGLGWHVLRWGCRNRR